MKLLYKICILFSTVLLSMSCSKQSVTSSSNNNNNSAMYGEVQHSRNNTGSTVVIEENNTMQNATMDYYLQQVAGVNITGTGASANVTIRGINSFVSNLEPLFLINGQAMNNFSTVYYLCNANNIKSVAVLKDAASCSIYGARGANGVIAITLKK
ncbi:TonB-dependent SusC/RagA subfamily outer membrane receptor [Arcicella aurantiaca]|uniref:TonB-dependent SusC/RagA subfamily outer membrane receptor n=1 Tax=Arcicella aurantiaca TaxID=591202 RepID=A0A316EH64_9BACT|nr:TonB-dependent receptor plug domain-containing protein [Arcicella aurantiaca]PWK28825.1 TonB-dependent SusC/RagA subfamily outer membrane receptor [Arcicella aurantiaca]